MMKAFQLKAGAAGLDRLQLVERARPAAKSGQVVVCMRAAAINFRDILIVRDLYPLAIKPELVPLSDGAGEVVEVGEGVTSLAIGDRVVSAFFPDWRGGAISAKVISSATGGSVDGVLAQYVAVPAHAALKFADHLTFEEAATLPCAGVTAWNAVAEASASQSNETILLQGTGGVSIFALQFAKLRGAKVIHTSSADIKLDRVKRMGADEVVNYRTTPEWGKQVVALNGNAGVDRVIEVGGPGTMAQSVEAVRIGGTIASIGLVTGPGPVDLVPLILRAVHFIGIHVGSHAMFEAMNNAIGLTGMRPVVGKVFEFGEARDAFEYMMGGAHFGKVVISIG